VRCERLQDISDEDCLQEGIAKRKWDVWGLNIGGEHVTNIGKTPQLAFEYLIDKINGKGTWESNPYVWVYDYKLIEK